MNAEPELRIAILLPSAPHCPEGLEVSAHELGTHLAAAGHAITLFSAVPLNRAMVRGMRHVRLRAPARGPLARPRLLAAFLARAARGYDLAYAFAPASVVQGLWPLLSAAPLWLNLYGVAEARGIARLWQRLREWTALAGAAAVVVDTDAALELLRARHRRLPPALVIPLGTDVVGYADPEPLVDFELAPGCYYLLVGRLVPENHVREIIEGFLAAHSAFPLVIVGDLEHDTNYVSQLRRLAGARVRFMGVVDDSMRLRVLRCHARAYFHGHCLGGERGLFEALACGDPIIAHDNVFNRETAGDLARYFRSAEDIPAAVAWAEDLDGPERRALAAEAHERLRSRYAWERTTAHHLTAFESVPRLP